MNNTCKGECLKCQYLCTHFTSKAYKYYCGATPNINKMIAQCSVKIGSNLFCPTWCPIELAKKNNMPMTLAPTSLLAHGLPEPFECPNAKGEVKTINKCTNCLECKFSNKKEWSSNTSIYCSIDTGFDSGTFVGTINQFERYLTPPDWCKLNNGIQSLVYKVENGLILPAVGEKKAFPLIGTGQEFKRPVPQPQERKNWDKITPHVKLSECKFGEIYIIPPHMGNPRRTVRVLSTNYGHVSFAVLNDKKNLSTTIYLHNEDLVTKLLVKKKKLSNDL